MQSFGRRYPSPRDNSIEVVRRSDQNLDRPRAEIGIRSHVATHGGQSVDDRRNGRNQDEKAARAQADLSAGPNPPSSAGASASLNIFGVRCAGVKRGRPWGKRCCDSTQSQDSPFEALRRISDRIATCPSARNHSTRIGSRAGLDERPSWQAQSGPGHRKWVAEPMGFTTFRL
jgi:hypothetical protein